MRAKFEYLEPTSLDEACGLLQEHGADAKLLAGGTALVMWMRMGLLSPKFVINLEHVAGLDDITFDPADGLRIGAGVKHRDLELCPEVQGALSPAPGNLLQGGAAANPAHGHRGRQP